MSKLSIATQVYNLLGATKSLKVDELIQAFQPEQLDHVHDALFGLRYLDMIQCDQHGNWSRPT